MRGKDRFQTRTEELDFVVPNRKCTLLLSKFGGLEIRFKCLQPPFRFDTNVWSKVVLPTRVRIWCHQQGHSRTLASSLRVCLREDFIFWIPTVPFDC